MSDVRSYASLQSLLEWTWRTPGLQRAQKLFSGTQANEPLSKFHNEIWEGTTLGSRRGYHGLIFEGLTLVGDDNMY